MLRGSKLPKKIVRRRLSLFDSAEGEAEHRREREADRGEEHFAGSGCSKEGKRLIASLRRSRSPSGTVPVNNIHHFGTPGVDGEIATKRQFQTGPQLSCSKCIKIKRIKMQL